MTELFTAAQKLVAKIEAEEAAEVGRIKKLIADHEIGDGSGYWKRLHGIRSRLWIARMVREALS